MKTVSVPLLTICNSVKCPTNFSSYAQTIVSIFEHKILTDDFIAALKLYSNKEITTTFLAALERTPWSSAPYHKVRDDGPQREAKQLNVLCMTDPPMTSFQLRLSRGHDVTKVTQNTIYCLKTVQHLLHTVGNCGYFHMCTLWESQ